MNKPQSPKVFNLPAGVSFVDALSTGLLSEVSEEKEKLINYLILLPTRRACRSVRESFLRQTNGQPLLLPRLQAIGDIDEEELFIVGQGEQELDIPPAMSPLKRQILLARTISRLPNFTKGPEQDMALAHALGGLMDQIHTENLDLKDLPNLVDREIFADHWQITIDFLKILSEHWPQVLKEENVIDGADRRNRLINALNNHWQQNPPEFPVIAAGSTGSIPSTAALLKTISTLSRGTILLPGLDSHVSEQSWKNIEEGHPQATLKQLLERLDIKREDVKTWPNIPLEKNNMATREKLVSQIMLPSEQTDEWQKTKITSKEIKSSLENIKHYDCTTPQEEANLISILLREVLEDKEKTAALITPDRNLARRVALACHQWDIEIDDSGGQSLGNNPLGSYLLSCANACLEQLRPTVLLSLLKHEYTKGGNFKNFRSIARALDKDLLRGKAPAKGFEGLRQRFSDKENDKRENPDPEISDLINHLEKILLPFIEKLNDGFHDFSDFLDEHIYVAETLATSSDRIGEDILWTGEAGEETATFLSELRLQAEHFPAMTGHNYLAILKELMKGVTIRPRYGTHPRLMILGQLEARLVQADRVILAGLNEGIWPPDPGHDPWMSRPMRKDFGLPTPERSITLAAHDFSCGFCNKEVFTTRSERIDGAPTVPARWLQRLNTFLKANDIQSEVLYDGPHKKYLEQLSYIEKPEPIERPAPKPPASSRPTKLSVTKIETWLKDPYAIYASKILGLTKLKPLEKAADAADKGNILHDTLYEFTKKYPKDIPDTAREDFVTIANDIIQKQSSDETEWSFWKPRIIRLSDWFINHEKSWRQQASFRIAEIEGSITLSENINRPFELTARADRIDKMHAGGTAIIDYKSGGTYSMAKMLSGDLPQLSLEALIVTDGGFSSVGVPKENVNSIAYWKLTGSQKAGEIIEINDPTKLQQAITHAKDGLINLVQTFEKEEMPYYAIPRLDNAPRFNDYEHLERVKEWAALDENSEEAA